MKKIFFISLIFFVLQNCGYTPIYSKNQKVNFYIENLDFGEGDKELINFIKINLQRYLTKNGNRGYKIKTIIKYEKKPLSKNTAGVIEDYELISNIEFDVEHKEINKKYKITEKFIMSNLSDEFEEKQYERSIKQNMARSTISKLLIQLSKLNVN